MNRPKVRSTAEAASLDSHDRIVSIAKSALQSYIESFLNVNGSNRAFTRIVSPAALQYVTDKSLQDSPDPNKKPTQLARMFNEIRQKLPSIMIIDAGLLWEEPGLGGGLERVTGLNGKWQGWYRICARINVIVAVVTQDPETSSMLQNVLSIFFKQLRVQAGGSLMRSGKEHEYWEVRIPQNFTSTLNQASNVADDPKDQIWASTMELELQAEDLFVVEKEIPRVILDDGYVNEPDLAARFPPEIDAPDSVNLRDGSFMIVVNRMGDQHKLVLSDGGSTASIDLDTWTITPHRPGSFQIIVIDSTQPQDDAPSPWAHKVVASHSVSVTL